MSLVELFCDADNFGKAWAKQLASRQLGQGCSKPGAKPSLPTSEIMTIIIHFHQSPHRDFKYYYTERVLRHLRSEFSGLVSYNRFVELMPMVLLPLCLYLCARLGTVTCISFMDASAIPVCHNRRISRHKVFAGLATRGKTSLGWFYGFKLHLVVNDQGELLIFYLTPGNVDDRKPVPKLAKKLFGDKGYLSQALFVALFAQGVQLITPLRKNMDDRPMPLLDKLLSRKRAIIEIINDQLKNISQNAHTRHRSVDNFLVNLIADLIAYTHQEKKSSIHLLKSQQAFFTPCCYPTSNSSQ